MFGAEDKMILSRLVGTLGLALIALSSISSVSGAQTNAYSYVANTRPPDAFLALKAYPSSNSPRIMAMANGTKLDVLLRRVDGWWYVKVWPTGEEGWAFSGQGDKAWILCCATGDGSQTENKPVAKEITDFSCEQLWFGRNSIFKEAGYCFKTPRAISAFGNAGCQYDDINAVRLSAENQNLA
jgi:YARHG domain